MSKIIPNDLLAIRGQFAYIFRSDLEKISNYLDSQLTDEVLKSELLNKQLIDNLWEVGLIIVKECVLKHNDVEKASKLLNMFADYQHTFSEQIEDCFKNCSKSVMQRVSLNHDTGFNEESQSDDSQIELVGDSEASYSISIE